MKKIVCLLIVACAVQAASAEFTLDDITFWTGTGSNRAAMVVTWSMPELINPDYSVVPAPIATQTMVWGYRFDGAKSGEDMFNAIIAADSHLYAMVSGNTQYGKAVFGIGYDLDNDGYGLTDGWAPLTFTNGLAKGSYSDPDWYYPTDSDDLYWGGWYGPNWELWHEQGGNGGFNSEPDRGSDPYWTPGTSGFDGAHGEWVFSGVGMSGLSLEDGSWMGWTVAAAGLIFGDDGDQSSILWYGHKVAPPVIPEPATMALLGLGGLLLRKRN